jgi:hypothetical protein
MKQDEQDEQDAFEPFDESEARADKTLAWRRFDVLLGLLLLVGVAGWAGWNWWQEQEAASNYQAGERYAAAHDWEAARASFLAAGDFPQASARAIDASKQISDRDATYAAALAERDAGNWAGSLRDFRQVQAVEPGFRDSVALERQVEEQVYSQALSGTVALRSPDPPGAGQPGLYLYLAGGWKYLPGSDLSSQVRSNSSYPCLVYDTPSSSGPDRGSASSPTAISAGSPGDPFALLQGRLGAASGRRALTAVQYGDKTLSARPLAFDLREFARFTCDDSGVTGESYAASSENLLDIRLAYTRGIQFHSRAYQAYDSQTVTPMPSLGPAWAILTDDSRQRLVVGDFTGALGNSRKTTLYVSDSKGDLSPVAERPAVVQAAWLSPDGRFLVADEWVPVGTGPEEHRLVLLYSDGSQDRRRAPEVLMSTKRRDQQVVGNAWYDAAFIESGPFAGKLLIERRTYPDGELRLIDPNEPGKTIWTTNQIDFVGPLQVFSLSGGVLLPLNSMATSSLPALYVSAAGKSTLLALPIQYDETLAAAMEIEGQLVYVLQNRGIGSSELVSKVFSIALPGTSVASGAPVELVSSVDAADSGREMGSYTESGQGWSFGRGLLAYIRQGQLEVKTYDGAVSLPLEGRVLKLYPLLGSSTGTPPYPSTGIGP